MKRRAEAIGMGALGPWIRGVLMLVLAGMLLCLGGCVGADSAKAFEGTWDLQYGHAAKGSESLSAENVASMRSLGLDAYLVMDESGSLALVTFDEVQRGDWKVTSASTANATIEGQSANILLQGDDLHLIQQDTTLVFSKGDPKDSEPSASTNAPKRDQGESDHRLADLVVRGELIHKPITVVDDELCTMVIDGWGVDRLGDPGFNVQLTNKGKEPIDVWVAEPFTVAGRSVKTYFCETIAPGRTHTAFIQFDTADLGSANPRSLVDVHGTLLVDDEKGDTIAELTISVAQVA